MRQGIVLFCIGLALLIVWCTVRLVANVQFDRGCQGYLKRAADANTVELAREQVKTALDYMEKNDLTSGYTSVLWRTPDEDIGFWAENVKTAYQELLSIDDDSTKLERSNMLMKLRETLIDDSAHGVHVTAPDGISIYPQNALWFGVSLIGLVLACVGLLLMTIGFMD